MTAALDFALWLRSRYSRPDALTHLKLQKLAFYCYGAVAAEGHEDALGNIEFEAWEHGPVNRDIWRNYKGYGAAPLPASFDIPPSYSPVSEAILNDALTIYGLLTAWELREESHLEEPWVDAWKAGRRVIDSTVLKAYFRNKFAAGRVNPPEHLVHLSSFRLDGIPVSGFGSLHDLAETIASLES